MSAAPFFDFSSLIRNWISALRIRTAHRTNVIKLKFQLHRQYPSPTSTLDLYFSSMIPFISMLWLRDSISLSICFNGMRGRTHWILLGSKVYFGHSRLYIWYNSAYIYSWHRYRKRPITIPRLKTQEFKTHVLNPGHEPRFPKPKFQNPSSDPGFSTPRTWCQVRDESLEVRSVKLIVSLRIREISVNQRN